MEEIETQWEKLKKNANWLRANLLSAVILLLFVIAFEVGPDLVKKLAGPSATTLGERIAQPFKVVPVQEPNSPKPRIEINLGKEYALRDHAGEVLNLSEDFQKDPGLKTAIDITNTFCYLGEVRGPLNGADGADLELQNDSSGKVTYFVHFFASSSSAGVVRISCVKVSPPPTPSGSEP
jgi:hypothetical protein